jgi:hypothetical protein
LCCSFHGRPHIPERELNPLEDNVKVLPIKYYGSAHAHRGEQGTDCFVEVAGFDTQIVDGMLAIQAAPFVMRKLVHCHVTQDEAGQVKPMTTANPIG